MLWGCVDFALMAESRRVVEHVRLHPVGGCSAQRLTNQPTNLFNVFLVIMTNREKMLY